MNTNKKTLESLIVSVLGTIEGKNLLHALKAQYDADLFDSDPIVMAHNVGARDVIHELLNAVYGKSKDKEKEIIENDWLFNEENLNE